MRRPASILAILFLIAACAAEDPVAQTTGPSPPTAITSTTAPAPVTTETEHRDEDEHEDHADDEIAHGEEHGKMVHGDEAPREDDATEIEGRMIQITMSEFAFEPTSIEVSAGETVTFMIENVGAIEHEFRLSNAHRIEEHIASGHADHD